MSSNYDNEAPGYTPATVMEEAARCLLCHDAPCSQDCPAGTDPGKFIRSIRFGNVRGAAETIRENNALGAVCARVCPTEKYCQKGCSRSGIDRPIDIGGIQRYATDFETAADMKILEAGKSNGLSVAIIGSGPSGLQAAATLASLGYSVTIFEEKQEPGGYLRYGIPEYRLPDAVVSREVGRIGDLGVEIRCGVKVAPDQIADLKKKYNAILLATGFGAGKMLPMFEGNPAVETAVDFLARIKTLKGFGAEKAPNHAVVVGGGDVAMDVATTLKKLGVPYVTDLAYEEFSEFLASKKELAGARQAGVTIMDGYVPASVDGNVVTFRHRHLDAQLLIKADKIILAIGQRPEMEPPKEKNYRTDDKQIFVTGDLAAGDMTVVWAVRKGKGDAFAIHESLNAGRDN